MILPSRSFTRNNRVATSPRPLSSINEVGIRFNLERFAVSRASYQVEKDAELERPG